MLEYIAVGAGLAFTAAVQPGPLQAYLLSRVAAYGWRRTLPAALAPLVSDGPIALVALLLLGQLSPAMQGVLRIAGGILLFYFAWRTFQDWRQPAAGDDAVSEKVPRTLWEATLVNLLNPNPYLGWALILGPIAVEAWREEPAQGVAVVVAFYATMTSMLALSIYAFGAARFLGQRLQRSLLLVSAVILAGLAVYQLARGLEHFIA